MKMPLRKLAENGAWRELILACVNRARRALGARTRALGARTCALGARTCALGVWTWTIAVVLTAVPLSAQAPVAAPAGPSPNARPADTRTAINGPDDLGGQLLTIRRVFVDRLTGGETAAQLRDIIIGSLQNSRLFILTENQERADVILRGAAEDLVFTDAFQSSEGINMHGAAASSSGMSTDSRYNGAGSGVSDRSSRSVTMGVGENDSSNIKERRHEALATVRLVNKDGDVIWSTTQESTGAKFRGASADVAEKITRQLLADYEKARNHAKTPQPRSQP